MLSNICTTYVPHTYRAWNASHSFPCVKANTPAIMAWLDAMHTWPMEQLPPTPSYLGYNIPTYLRHVPTHVCRYPSELNGGDAPQLRSIMWQTELLSKPFLPKNMWGSRTGDRWDFLTKGSRDWDANSNRFIESPEHEMRWGIMCNFFWGLIRKVAVGDPETRKPGCLGFVRRWGRHSEYVWTQLGSVDAEPVER